eukprot:6211194-Pleurochrysis_carterae.AAC.4
MAIESAASRLNDSSERAACVLERKPAVARDMKAVFQEGNIAPPMCSGCSDVQAPSADTAQSLAIRLPIGRRK